MTAAQKAKRTFSFQQKQQILSEHFEDGLSISSISRKHQINAVTLYNWKKMFMTSEKPPKASDLSPEEIATLVRDNEALRKAVADLAMDKAVLKEAVEILKKKQTQPAWFRSPKK
jgi:transposase-like protein